MKYAILIEEGESNYGAYAPDISGCIGLGSTPERARKDLLDGLVNLKRTRRVVPATTDAQGNFRIHASRGTGLDIFERFVSGDGSWRTWAWA